MDAISFYRAGQLDQAIAAALASVKSAPRDTAARFLLVELLCFFGDWDRADKQLDAIAKNQQEDVLFAILLKQLIRGEILREQVVAEGRPPKLIRELPEHAQLQLKLFACLRDEDYVAARNLVIEARELRPMVKGTCNNVAFMEFQDLDDRFAGVVEIITSNGDYYWVPNEYVRSITFEIPERPADLIWRKAVVDIENGPQDTMTYIPVRYPFPKSEGWDDQLRLGRATSWTGDSEGVVRGLGQRMFLVGDESQSIMDLANLQIHGPE